MEIRPTAKRYTHLESALKQLVGPRVTAFETSGPEVVVDKKPAAVTLTVERPPR